MRRMHGVFNTTYKQEAAIFRTRFEWGILIVLFLLIAILPHIISPGWFDFFIRIGITLLVVLGLNLVTGFCGQVSLGHAAFMGWGGFVGAILLNAGLPFIVVVPLAGLSAGIAGLIFGLPALRVKGIYLCFSTLAAHYIIIFILIRLMGGERGYQVNPVNIFGLAINSEIRLYYLVFVMVGLATFVAKNIVRGKAGQAFVAVRDHEIAADTLGINVYYYKLLAFFIGCFYAGVGGVLMVIYFGWASVEHFTLWNSIWYIGMILIGGMGSIIGTFFGTVFVMGVEQFSFLLAPIVGRTFPGLAETAIGALPMLIFGLIIMLFIVYEPHGLAHRWEIIKESFRRFPFN